MADHHIPFVATASTVVAIPNTGQSRNEAIEEAYSEVYVSLCHECARKVDLGDFEAEDDSRDVDAELAAAKSRIAELEAAERQAAEAVSKTVVRFSTTLNERDELRARVAALDAFVADIVAHGLRCDLTPTTNFGVTAGEMYTNLTDYLRRADTAIRDRARAILPAEEAGRAE